ncbi:MAG: hypothetical protein ACJ8F3_07930 [Xanthobacteraceae bacterium]
MISLNAPGTPRADDFVLLRPALGVLRAALLTILLSMTAAIASAGERPRLYTHETYMRDLTNDTVLPLDDPKAMLTFVLESLPDRVKVYPTESYYYFQFYHQGVRYAGNLRLDMMDRDKGKLHFAYFEDLQEWKADAPLTYRVFDATDGVSVEKIDLLVYRVTYGEKAVVFELNNLSNLKPPPQAIGPDEQFIGPMMDDSGIRFFLIFNPKLKLFHYILDETTRVPDQFRPSTFSNRILIGVRTGFAYYQDLRMNRKILIGVFEANSRVNNYFDGPFDQLPDNFVKGDELRDAILAVEPALKDKIDRVGGSFDGSGRFLIGPYATYRTEEQLYPIHYCATSKSVPAESYYQCFVVEQEFGEYPVPLPLKQNAQQVEPQTPGSNQQAQPQSPGGNKKRRKR